ncbi:MAG: hypothetical protein LBC12_01570 [Nitrososphaerota archaeon]|nr:hypothetical protein [Nitrososphaerota archaeon]
MIHDPYLFGWDVLGFISSALCSWAIYSELVWSVFRPGMPLIWWALVSIASNFVASKVVYGGT